MLYVMCGTRNVTALKEAAWARLAKLRAERSGDQIPVEERFSATVQIGPGAHPVSCTVDKVAGA